MKRLTTNLFVRLSLGVCLWGAAAFAQTTSPVLLPAVQNTLSFGMIGLAAGQTVRLSVVNIVRTPAPLGIALAACRVELDLYDGQGNLIKQNPIDNLSIGKSAFVEADRGAISEASVHVEVTGAVKLLTGQSFFCSITPTLEVYDTATGRTQSLLSNTSTAPVFIRPLVVEPAQ